jgi:hypothetical protein
MMNKVRSVLKAIARSDTFEIRQHCEDLIKLPTFSENRKEAKQRKS